MPSRGKGGRAWPGGVNRRRRHPGHGGTRTTTTPRSPRPARRRSSRACRRGRRRGRPARADALKTIQTGTPYRGGNSVYLSVTQTAKGYRDHRWATYKHIHDMGGQVRTGEQATHVLFYKFDDQQEKAGAAEPEQTRPPMVRVYAVFNVEQTDHVRRATGATTKTTSPSGRPTSRPRGDSRERDSRRPRTRRPSLLQHADRQGDTLGA